MKHYIKTMYKAVLQLQDLFHMIQIAFYRFYTLNIIRLRLNYAHKLNPLGTAETPHNIIELENQTKLIKQYLRRRTQSRHQPNKRLTNS